MLKQYPNALNLRDIIEPRPGSLALVQVWDTSIYSPQSPSVDRSDQPSTHRTKTKNLPSDDITMYHSPIQIAHGLPTGQSFNQGSQQWANQGAPRAYEPMQPEPRFDDARNKPFDNRFHSINRFEYRLGDNRNLDSTDNCQHYSWPPQRNGEIIPTDGIQMSPTRTSSISSSPRDESYSWAGTSESTERKVCHCGKEFRRPSDLAKHQKYHIKYFSCLFSGCEKAFATQKDLSRHVRTHRKGEGWRCTVDGCRKAAAGHVYSRKDNFDRHMRTAHTNS